MSAPYVVCCVQHGEITVVGRYEAPGDAKRQMRAVGPTGHVVCGGEAFAVHPNMDPALSKKLDKLLDNDTHPALREPAPAPAESEPEGDDEGTEPDDEAGEPEETTEPAGAEASGGESAEAGEGSEPELTEDQQLVLRAIERAGGLRPLATAIEYHSTSLCSAKTGSRALSAPLRAKLEAYLAKTLRAWLTDGAPAPVSKPSRAAQVEPVAPRASKRRAPSVAPAPIPVMAFPEERTVTVTVPESLARGLYQSAREAGDDKAALLWGDALFGGAS